jgi:hypothetical protein
MPGVLSVLWVGAQRVALPLALCLFLGPAQAHDTTLIIERAEPRRLNLVLVIDPVQSLHQWLAPELNLPVFLAAYVQKAPSEFHRELQSAQKAIERGMRLGSADGIELRLLAWNWPSAAQWQDSLRERLQRLLAAGPGLALHSPTLEIQAQARSPRPLDRIRLSLPTLLHPTLVRHAPADEFWIGTLSPVAYLDL